MYWLYIDYIVMIYSSGPRVEEVMVYEFISAAPAW